MPIVFHIPSPLREFTQGRTQVTIEASPATAQEALEALWELHPGVRDRVLNERCEVRTHINVFVGGANIRWTGGLATALPPDAEISIFPAVSGG